MSCPVRNRAVTLAARHGAPVMIGQDIWPCRTGPSRARPGPAVPGAWRNAGSGYSGADPLADQAAEFGVRLQVASAGLGDEAPYIAAFLVEKKEQPPGFACAC
jgi:hypothetical protein